MDNIKKKRKTGSIWSVEYWIRKGLTEEEAKIKVSSIQKENSRKSAAKFDPEKNSIWNKRYWINQGLSETDAAAKVYEIQAANSKKSTKFAGHNHTAKSKEKISIGSKKQAAKVRPLNMQARFGVLTNNGISKPEVECYETLKQLFPNLDDHVGIHGFVVDMLLDKLIIEFNGDYWHCNPAQFNENYWHDIVKQSAKEIWHKDFKRQSALKKYGYDIFVIWESDWKNNKNNIITELCLKVESLKKK